MNKFVLPGVAALLVAGAVLGWTFYQRHEANEAFARAQEQKALEAGRRFRQAYGSDTVRISGIRATPGIVSPGQRTIFCYGVMNAKAVHLDPPVEPVHPSPSYCFDLYPKKTTTYTITADDGNGGSATKSLTVTVK